MIREGAGRSGRKPPVLAASEDHVRLVLLEVLAGDLALPAAIADVRGEGGRRGVGHLRGRHEAGRAAASARRFEEAPHGGPVVVDADGAVDRPHAGRERRPRRGGVRDRVVGVVGIRVLEPRDGQRVHLQVAPQRLAEERAVRGAHPVADEQDDVARPVTAAVLRAARRRPRPRRQRGGARHPDGDHAAYAARQPVRDPHLSTAG
jgi:hypothetical protein